MRRLCLLVPASPIVPITLSTASPTALEILVAEGNAVLDLGLADARLSIGVSPVCELLELWGLDAEQLLDLRARLRGIPETVPNRVSPDSALEGTGKIAP
jgi:hypothetical protein